jgi:uncharacterized membrane protein YhaH (DUF805 family)
MGFGDAINSVLRQNYANFSGRARRSEFWYWALFTVIVGIVLGIIRAISAPLGLALEAIWGLATIVPFVAVAVRRFHDTGKSGWFFLLYIPGIVVLFIPAIVAIVFWCQDSDGDNKYGPNLKGLGGGGYGGPDASYPPQYGAPGGYPPPPSV